MSRPNKYPYLSRKQKTEIIKTKIMQALRTKPMSMAELSQAIGYSKCNIYNSLKPTSNSHLAGILKALLTKRDIALEKRKYKKYDRYLFYIPGTIVGEKNTILNVAKNENSIFTELTLPKKIVFGVVSIIVIFVITALVTFINNKFLHFI